MKRTLRINTIQILAALIGLSLIQSIAFAQTPQVKLEEGTEVRLKLMQAISSGTAQTGQTISFQVLDEVKVDGEVVIAEGAPAWGTITEAEGKKSLGRGGKLSIQIDYVKAVDGSKVPLRASSVNQGKGRGATVGAATAATAVVFWPAAPFLLMMKGKNVEIPRGHHIPAFVDGDRMIAVVSTDRAPNAAPDAMRNNGAPGFVQASLNTAQPAAGRVAGATDFGAINVISDPGGAEIEIDGAYYGNTPGLIKLAAGLHTITIRYAGHEAWKRTLNIGPGSNLTVKADLVKPPAQAARRNGAQ